MSKYPIKSLTLTNDGEEDDLQFIINQLEIFNSQLKYLSLSNYPKETLDSTI